MAEEPERLIFLRELTLCWCSHELDNIKFLFILHVYSTYRARFTGALVTLPTNRKRWNTPFSSAINSKNASFDRLCLNSFLQNWATFSCPFFYRVYVLKIGVLIILKKESLFVQEKDLIFVEGRFRIPWTAPVFGLGESNGYIGIRITWRVTDQFFRNSYTWIFWVKINKWSLAICSHF